MQILIELVRGQVICNIFIYIIFFIKDVFEGQIISVWVSFEGVLWNGYEGILSFGVGSGSRGIIEGFNLGVGSIGFVIFIGLIIIDFCGGRKSFIIFSQLDKLFKYGMEVIKVFYIIGIG